MKIYMLSFYFLRPTSFNYFRDKPCHCTILFAWDMAWRMGDGRWEAGPPRPDKRVFSLSSPTKIRAYILTLLHSFQDYYSWQRIKFIRIFVLERETKLGRCTYKLLGINRVPRVSTLLLQKEE